MAFKILKNLVSGLTFTLSEVTEQIAYTFLAILTSHEERSLIHSLRVICHTRTNLLDKTAYRGYLIKWHDGGYFSRGERVEWELMH